MSPTATIFEKPTQAETSAVDTAQTLLFPGLHLQCENLRYLNDSLLYELKGGFVAEVIQNPGEKFLRAGVMNQVYQELSFVALEAFGKTQTEAETYVPQDVLAKNAIWVDWLIVVRKKGHPVAFGSATYITPFLLYLSSAMVLPAEQPTGVGVVANSLLWKLAVQEAKDNGLSEPDIICRTHNRNVASVLAQILRNSKISTENSRDTEAQLIFMKTANHLHCNYNPETGISQNVYPEGLPAGTKTKDARINQAFQHLGPQDACYVTGMLRMDFVNKLVGKYVRPHEPVQEKAEKVGILPSMVPSFA